MCMSQFLSSLVLGANFGRNLTVCVNQLLGCFVFKLFECNGLCCTADVIRINESTTFHSRQIICYTG